MPARPAPELRSPATLAVRPPSAAAAPPVSMASPGQPVSGVRLRYLARAPILVRGATSGAAYRFSATQAVQAVQRADVEPLLATGHFRREA